jgi:membrane protease YdiL (CAAX protease family)
MALTIARAVERCLGVSLRPVTPRVWPVFLAYLLAVLTIILASVAALGALRAIHPDLPDTELMGGVLGLIAGGLASSTALVLTVVLVSQPFDAAGLRLVPGRETGATLAAAVLGMLSLGQVLDSTTMLAGLGQRGSMPAIRKALAGVDGVELLGAVVVLGVMAGAAEEVFFRGYMQTRLRLAWHVAPAIAVTSAAFALLHMEWIHAAMAFVLGLYLGVLTERAGSALPAIVCHVVNNSVFTVVTALTGTIDDVRTNAILLVASAIVFLACGGLLVRRLPRASG